MVAAIPHIADAEIVTYGLTTARGLASAGYLLSIEGPNEPNNFPFTYNGQTCG